MAHDQTPLVTGEIYHIFTRSIAKFQIFNSDTEYLRMLSGIKYYQINEPDYRLSWYLKASKEGLLLHHKLNSSHTKLIQIIAYCLMPTHIHLILKQLKDGGISKFMSNALNSYTRYFNTKHRRSGPLWESRFKKVHVETDEQLLHLTRYLHINPTTSLLVNNPKDWKYSSYLEYLSIDDSNDICEYDDIIKIVPENYRQFVEERINYQKELNVIKKLILE